jgi:hypothetical protein
MESAMDMTRPDLVLEILDRAAGQNFKHARRRVKRSEDAAVSVDAKHRRWRDRQADQGIERKSIRAPIAAMRVIERLATKVLAGEPLDQVLRELAPAAPPPELRAQYFEQAPAEVAARMKSGEANNVVSVWLNQQLRRLNHEHRALMAEHHYLVHKLDIARAYEEAGMRLYKLRGELRRRAFYQVGLSPKDRLPVVSADVLRELAVLKDIDDGKAAKA